MLQYLGAFKEFMMPLIFIGALDHYTSTQNINDTLPYFTVGYGGFYSYAIHAFLLLMSMARVVRMFD